MKNNKFLNDEELSKLDKYKSLDLLRSINECNLYVQNGAIVTMFDADKNGYSIVNRSSKALHSVMDYVNNGSVTREAIVSILYNLFQYIEDNKLEPEDEEFRTLSFTINILHQILSENTMFKIYSCKKDFIPKASLNSKNVEILKDDVLYLLESGNFKCGKDTKFLYVFFNVIAGFWCYLSKSEMSNLKKEKVRKIN